MDCSAAYTYVHVGLTSKPSISYMSIKLRMFVSKTQLVQTDDTVDSWENKLQSSAFDDYELEIFLRWIEIWQI